MASKQYSVIFVFRFQVNLSKNISDRIEYQYVLISILENKLLLNRIVVGNQVFLLAVQLYLNRKCKWLSAREILTAAKLTFRKIVLYL